MTYAKPTKIKKITSDCQNNCNHLVKPVKTIVYAGLWCLTPLSQYFSYIMAVSFILGGNRDTQRKQLTFRMSLTNIIT